MKKLIAFTIITLFVSCRQGETNRIDTPQFFDTLKVSIQNSSQDTAYLKMLNTYYYAHGIVVQKYFQIIDSLKINLNADSIQDEILIFSPIALDDPEVYNPKIDSFPERILVEIINSVRGSKIGSVYNNVISDVGGVLFNFVGLEKTPDGFLIKHEAGNKASWFYSVNLVVREEKLKVKSIKKICSYLDKEDIIDYSYDFIDVNKLNIEDTLQNNCNCEKSWERLMKKQGL